MRHRKAGLKLNRTPSHRNAMFRNMVTSLFKYERIRTTGAKAKEIRRWADHLITLAKRGDLHARRQALSIVREKEVVHKLFEHANEWFGAVSGGYTRVIKLGVRPGDAAPMSLVELIVLQDTKKKKTKKKKSKTEGKQTKKATAKKTPAPAEDIEEDKEEKASSKTKAKSPDKKEVAEVKTKKASEKKPAAKAKDDEPSKAKTEPTVEDVPKDKPVKKTQAASKKQAATDEKKAAPETKKKKAPAKKTEQDEK